ncbi:MAG: hypothetical protein KF782_07925 [Labilithrix sp.]|nr:hypothetical protein [Labilithrix sp.]
MPRWSIAFAGCLAACGLSVTGAPPAADAGPGGSEDGSTTVADASADEREGASSDAGPDADGGVRGWCATQPAHEICVDFDDGQIVLAASNAVAAPSAIDGTESRSAPNSLRSEATTIGASSYVHQSWGGGRSVVDLGFDVFVDGAGYAQIGGVELFPTTGYAQLLFEYDDSTLSFMEFAGGAKTAHALGPAALGWHRLELHVELALAPAKGKAVVKQDGVVHFDGELAHVHGALTNVKADVGIVYCGKIAPVRLFVDNVTIDSKP